MARDHGSFLYTVAYRLTGNDADAQDLVQEVLLRVRRGLPRYQPRSLEGWLTTIATNAFLDEARRRRRRRTEILPADPDRVLPPTPSAEGQAGAEQLPDDVQAALAALPADFRAVVVLTDIVGLSYDETARAVGVPVGTVRSRLHRGRAALRRALTP